MSRSPELVSLTSLLSFWQVYDPAVKSDLFSTAARCGDRLFLIDPTPLDLPLLEQIQATAPVAGILVTNANHPRAAAEIAGRLGVPIFAAEHFPGLEASETRLTSEEKIAPGLEAIALPGAAAGELAFHFAADGGTLVVGDALINFEPYGFALLPAKYCTDQKQLRQSLRRLLDWPFRRLLFAHGAPILSGARERLETLLP